MVYGRRVIFRGKGPFRNHNCWLVCLSVNNVLSWSVSNVSKIIKCLSEGVWGYQVVSRSVKMYQKASSIKIIEVVKVMKNINGLT